MEILKECRRFERAHTQGVRERGIKVKSGRKEERERERGRERERERGNDRGREWGGERGREKESGQVRGKERGRERARERERERERDIYIERDVLKLPLLSLLLLSFFLALSLTKII